MLNPDELDSQRPKKQPLDFQQMSVADLKTYITSLEGEITRAMQAIEQKEKHKKGAAALFS